MEESEWEGELLFIIVFSFLFILDIIFVCVIKLVDYGVIFFIWSIYYVGMFDVVSVLVIMYLEIIRKCDDFDWNFYDVLKWFLFFREVGIL